MRPCKTHYTIVWRIIALQRRVINAGVIVMDLIKVMLALYESEINCGMESFWDGGFTVWLGLKSMGDDMEEKNFAVNELAKDAGKWLHDAALKYYPNSIYTMNFVNA